MIYIIVTCNKGRIYNPTPKTGEPVEEIVGDFEQRFDFTQGFSSVGDGTRCIDIVDVMNKGADDRQSNKLAIIRRYNFKELSDWSEGMDFKIVDSLPLPDDEVLGGPLFVAAETADRLTLAPVGHGGGADEARGLACTRTHRHLRSSSSDRQRQSG